MSASANSAYLNATRTQRTCALFSIALLIAGFIAVGIPAFAESSTNHGAEVYAKANCAACHGGLGYGGAGPRFRGDKLLSADTYVVGQILIGRGIMPAFGDTLSNDEIAAVATYIRTSWGNDFGPVSPSRVAEIRKSLTDQNTPAEPPP